MIPKSLFTGPAKSAKPATPEKAALDAAAPAARPG
jgi:hypothetical protein